MEICREGGGVQARVVWEAALADVVFMKDWERDWGGWRGRRGDCSWGCSGD